MKMNNVIFTNFGDNEPLCCDIGDIWVQCDNPAKVEAEWKEAEKYRWHDLRKDSDICRKEKIATLLLSLLQLSLVQIFVQ